MLTIEKINKIIQVVYEIYPALKGELIEIIEGTNFSMIETIGSYTVTYNKKLDKDDKYKKSIVECLRKHHDFKDSDLMYSCFEETFSFLHEIEPIYYNYTVDSQVQNIQYSNFRNMIHENYDKSFFKYRQIETEKLADKFAINILKSNKKAPIWAIMNDIILDKAKEEIEFWSMF